MLKQPMLRVFLVAILSCGAASGSDQGVEGKQGPEEIGRSAAKDERPSGQQGSVRADQPTFKSFSKDLGKNFLGLFSEENLLPLLVGAGAAGISLSVDDRVNDWFGNVDDDILGREKSKFGSLQEVGEVLGTQWVVATSVGGLIVANHFTQSERFNAFTYASAQGVLLNTILTSGLKYAVRRDRPDHSNRRSFPSGHTSNMFTMATIASHYYGPRVGIPAYLVAGMVGVTRMEEGVHFLSDVVAGATLGYIVGRTVVRGTDRSRRIMYFPIVSAQDKTVGVMVTARF